MTSILVFLTNLLIFFLFSRNFHLSLFRLCSVLFYYSMYLVNLFIFARALLAGPRFSLLSSFVCFGVLEIWNLIHLYPLPPFPLFSQFFLFDQFSGLIKTLNCQPDLANLVLPTWSCKSCLVKLTFYLPT